MSCLLIDKVMVKVKQVTAEEPNTGEKELSTSVPFEECLILTIYLFD